MRIASAESEPRNQLNDDDSIYLHANGNTAKMHRGEHNVTGDNTYESDHDKNRQKNNNPESTDNIISLASEASTSPPKAAPPHPKRGLSWIF
jgi:hypothetical protein